MSLLDEAAKAYLGVESDAEYACETVEPGAVRRHAQAIMDEDSAYGSACEGNARYGGAIAPPLFPTHMFRRPFGAPDPVRANANDPDYDGSILSTAQTLPAIEPLAHLSVLNGGSEFEFYRHARHGERVQVRSRYADIHEKQTSKGPMVVVVIESTYSTGEGELLMRVRRTLLRRPQ